MKEAKLSTWDLEELAAFIVSEGDEKQADTLINDGSAIDVFEDQAEVSFDDFGKIVSLVINFCPVLESPLTKELSHCIGVIDEHGFRAIIKSPSTVTGGKGEGWHLR